MKKTLLFSSLIAIFMATGTPASAQEHRDNNGRGHDEQQRRGDDHRNDQADHNGRDGRDGRDDRNDRGAGPRHDMRRGGRLPSEYRSKQYVVDDWRGHRLSAPPRGYHWVQTGGDYVLVAVATGLIAQILLNN